VKYRLDLAHTFFFQCLDPTYFPGHAASIHVSLNGKDHVIGAFGILHPTVLENYDLKYPVSTLELNIEVFL
jgi:phenylalanyl-tRNA synthetase beta chain